MKNIDEYEFYFKNQLKFEHWNEKNCVYIVFNIFWCKSKNSSYTDNGAVRFSSVTRDAPIV